MATPEAVAEKRELAGINADYKEKFGFHDPESGYAYKAPKGLSREVVESISEYKDEPQWMRDFRLKADPELGRQPRPDRLRRHPLLRPRLRKEQPRLE
jgi:Fe-S cluster assembly protein SufB